MAQAISILVVFVTVAFGMVLPGALDTLLS